MTSAKRSAAEPDFPTRVESGFPGFEVLGWNGVHVPNSTPKALISKINTDMLRVLKLADVRERTMAAGMETSGTSPEEFARFVKSDPARWTALIKKTGIRPE